MIVVSDTSAICYLVLIDAIDLLHQLFGELVIPSAIHEELTSHGAPEAVRSWVEEAPFWLQIRSVTRGLGLKNPTLHTGEREVLTLAVELGADLVILDDKAARQEARNLGLRLTGLLGILDLAAGRDLLNLRAAIARLRRTNFRIAPKLLRALLKKHHS